MPRHKVFLVPFPFDDLWGTKVRPAVCLTEAIGMHHHVVVAFITSKVVADDLEEWDIVLEPSQDGFAATGLRVPSTIRLHRLSTVPQSLLLRELGELSQDTQVQIAEKLHKLFA
ncbi:MAG: type II toxin-antitoxin system PemK/MazF family toxin [SAR202 cluster bacterium]|nr:type II toxin-antitoxin system PemK/MazF family toxin [SAR202 cluster bacterium]